MMQVMVQLGVTLMPAAYVLKRWTWLAEEMLVDIADQVPGRMHEMPEESLYLMRTATYNADYSSLIKIGCRTGDGRKILSTHLKEMKGELIALQKEQQKRASKANMAASTSVNIQSASAWTTSAPPNATSVTQIGASSVPCENSAPATSEPNIRDPPKSNTKGRSRKRTY